MKLLKDTLKLLFVLISLALAMMFFSWFLGGRSKTFTPDYFIEINAAEENAINGLREKNDSISNRI